MRWIAILIALGGCDIVLALGDRPTGDYRKQITITPSTGLPLLAFPVSVVLADDADLVAHAAEDGRDIHFTNDAGEVLPFERIAYVSGFLEAWVRLEEISGTTVFSMEYGGDVVASTASDTWSNSTFVAVWHMSGTGDVEEDSTQGNRNLAAIPGGTPGVAQGRVGRARDYGGTDAMCLAPGIQLDFGTSPFSYSVWVNVTTSRDVFDSPFEAGGGNVDAGGFNFELGTGSWTMNVNDGDSDVRPNNNQTVSIGMEATGRWVQLVAVVDWDAPRMIYTYRDGGPANAAAFRAELDHAVITENQICVGAPPIPGNSTFNGVIDEMRIYRRALAAEWIEAEYDNLANRDRFMIVGDEERL